MSFASAQPEEEKILCNQIRSFIVQTLKFFHDKRNCDGSLVAQYLNDIAAQVEILLDQIKTRQTRLAWENGKMFGATKTLSRQLTLDSEVEPQSAARRRKSRASRNGLEGNNEKAKSNKVADIIAAVANYHRENEELELPGPIDLS